MVSAISGPSRQKPRVFGAALHNRPRSFICAFMRQFSRENVHQPMTLVSAEVSQGRSGQIKLHGAEAFAAMHRAGRLTAKALDMLVPHVRPGVTTETLDRLVMAFARDHGAAPAPLYYRGYPKAICTSLNHVVCH